MGYFLRGFGLLLLYCSHASFVLDYFVVAVVLTSCDSGTLNPPPEGYDPDGRCSAGKNQILPEEEWDSLQVRCDTVFIRDTVIVYGDTVYEDTVVTRHNYIGFKYFDRYTEDYDTLVGIRVDERPELSDSYRCGHRPVYCDLDSSQKTFSCQTGIFCYSIVYSTELSQSQVVAYPIHRLFMFLKGMRWVPCCAIAPVTSAYTTGFIALRCICRHSTRTFTIRPS